MAEKWGREGSVETLAFTGVAAINIRGRTMHSARNLKVHDKGESYNPSAEMRNRYSRVVLVIIDEISMTDQALLGRTDAVSRELSAWKREFLGGRHTLLLGDWLQLPSVAGSPCTFNCCVPFSASISTVYHVYVYTEQVMTSQRCVQVACAMLDTHSTLQLTLLSSSQQTCERSMIKCTRRSCPSSGGAEYLMCISRH